jgi:hypothetical protein
MQIKGHSASGVFRSKILEIILIISRGDVGSGNFMLGIIPADQRLLRLDGTWAVEASPGPWRAHC